MQQLLHRTLCADQPLRKALLRTKASTQRSIYTQKLLDTGVFTQRSFSTETVPQSSFLQRNFYTQKLVTHRSRQSEKTLHTETFTQRERGFFHKEAVTTRSFSAQNLLYTQRYRCIGKLLHKAAFTHFTQSFFCTKKLFTQKLLHTKILHREALTQRSSYTEKPLHGAVFPQRAYPLSGDLRGSPKPSHAKLIPSCPAPSKQKTYARNEQHNRQKRSTT